MSQDTLPPLEDASRSTEELFDKIEPVEFSTGTAATAKKTNFFLRPLALAVWLLFSGLAVVLWFMFTAKSVSFEFEPSPDSLQIHGGLLKFEIGGRHLLRPGRYSLIAEKSGYHGLDEEIEVSREPSQVMAFTMRKLPGILEVSTEPPVDGVEVTIDGEAAGSTPLEGLRLEPGTHQVRIKARRFLAYETKVDIEGMEVRQQLRAELTPNWAPVSISSKPSGASVWVDGEELGTTPAIVQVEAGERELELRLAKHNTWARSIMVEADTPKTIEEVVLKPADGRLLLSSEPPGANVTVGGKFRGRTPVKLFLPPGKPQEIRLSKAGYESVARTVRIESDQERSIKIGLKPQFGELNITTVPGGASLLVDGEPQGGATQRLSLTAVPHEIRVEKEGYAPYRQTVTPKPGFPQAIRVTLKTLEQVKFETTPTVINTSLGQALNLIRPKPFTMGSSRREQGRRSNETLREVALTRPYYLGTKEVTNKEFRAFSGSHKSGSEGRYSLDGDDQPVVNVTWQQAAAFCNWLSKRESLQPAYVQKDGKLVPASPMPASYRLPTEAEWAWAARFPGGTGPLKFPWGQEMPPTGKAGNYADKSAKRIFGNYLTDYDDRYPVTAPVGRFDPNGYGLFDLGGNASEWVHDYYNIPIGAEQVVRDPLGPAEGKYHVIRGSSWMHAGISELRLTFRDYGDDVRPDLGFRIARFME